LVGGLTVSSTDFPELDESKVPYVTGLMERSVGNVKALVESET
jgi:hypothetical protein